MKKILVLFGLFFITSVSHASQLNWAFYGLTEMIGQDVKAYLLSGPVTTVNSASDIIDNSISTGGAFRFEGEYAKTVTAIYTTDNTGEYAYYVYLIKVIDGTTSYWSAQMPKVKLETMIAKSIDYNDGDIGGNFDASLANGANWTTIGAVPEPTTLALLALGIAAFGLKRKVS